MSQRFGVEIEFKSVPKIVAALRIGAALGVDHVHCFGYKSTKCSLCNRSVPKEAAYDAWSVMTDRTVTDSRGDLEVGGEAISPILTVDNFDQINMIANTLQELGASVNLVTGLHVHVEMSNLTSQQRINVLTEWFKQEGSFFEEVENHRSINSQCESYADKKQEQDNLIAEFANGNSGRAARLSEITSKQRSMSVVSYPTLGTFEFRLHHGTLHAPTIQAWITRLLTFVDNAKGE